jgi:P27 family predicted phage terminase small subunit
MRGRKPQPTALRRANGNPGKRGWNHAEPVPPEGLPDCPEHLSEAATAEWHRLAGALHGMGVLSVVDRGALAAYCQAWGRWVEAEEKLKATPPMVRTPNGHVQQSPWMSVANKQLELMGRYMAELGLTPAARSRIVAFREAEAQQPMTINVVYAWPDGSLRDAEGREVDEHAEGTITVSGDL